MEKGFHSVDSYWRNYLDVVNSHRFVVSYLVLPIFCYIFCR